MQGDKNYLKKPIPVLYEDEAVIVFDKPSGLLVIPTKSNEPNTLVNIVNYQYAKDPDKAQLHPCHRLDRDTSGVILFAKGKRYQQILMDAFKQRKMVKHYVAFVQGKLKRSVGEISSYINDLDEKKYRKHSQAVLAITRYKLLEAKQKFSVVDVNPVTGRTNQIRIHFRDLGNPLVGERKYAFGRDYELKFRRVALHASRLEFESPIAGKKINVESKLAQDMEVFLDRN